jgi:mono/diheme cytochrome c family protein
MNRVMLLTALAWLATSGAAFAEPASYEQAVAPFLKTHCLRCHGETKPKGEFRVDNLARDFTDLASAQR